MALYKAVQQDDGVITDYHRVLFTQSHINSHVSVAVVSYIDRLSRDTESVETQPYKRFKTYETDYKENMTIEEIYAFLKSLPDFEGALDV